MPPKREPKKTQPKPAPKPDPEPEPRPEPEPESRGGLDRLKKCFSGTEKDSRAFISATPRRAQFNQIMNANPPRVRRLDISTPTQADLDEPLWDRLREIHRKHEIPGDPNNNYLWIIHEDIIDINDDENIESKIEKIDKYLNTLAQQGKLEKFRTHGPEDGVLFNINGRDINHLSPTELDQMLIQESSQKDRDRIKSQETHPTPRPKARLKRKSKRKKKKTRKKKKKTKKKR